MMHRMIIFAVFLMSCAAVGPDYERPEYDGPQAWKGRVPGNLEPNELDPERLAEWWKELEDDTLTGLVERAIASNLDLRRADAQLKQARAQRGVAGAAKFPTLGVSGQAGGTQQGGLYSASFDASWEADVFGGRRRNIEAADAFTRAALEARRDVLVSVAAEVVLNYIELRTVQTQLGLARRNLELQNQSLELVRRRLELGASNALELERAVGRVAATRAQIPNLEEQSVRACNRLAILLGEPPGALDQLLDGEVEIPAPEVRIAVGIPAEMIRRRPDVRFAEAKLAAETAKVGVAKAELYPKFVLSGSIGLESLASPVTSVFNLAGGLTAPIFDGGRRKRLVEAQTAVQEAALVDYEASILTALEDVENALTSFAKEQARLLELRASAESAARSTNIARARFEAGSTPYLDVLDAERTLLQTELDMAASAGAVASNVARLYKALGGGWAPESVPAESSEASRAADASAPSGS
ncbi:MAG: efflux transporter outer membrane subunit [Myxococcota bacterium]